MTFVISSLPIKHNVLRCAYRRNFSIMEYYRSVRPIPPDVDRKEKDVVVVPDVKASVTHIGKNRSTTPYYGPRITTRHAVPTTATTVSWEPPVQPENPKTIRIALVGLPNAGKSSLLNALVNSTITAVSPKVNTTREDVKGILTVDNCQMVFIDSPGIIASHRRRKFCKDLVKIAWHGYKEADLCLFVVDAVKRPTTELFEILRRLSARAPFADDYRSGNAFPEGTKDTKSTVVQDYTDIQSSEDDNEDLEDSKIAPIALVLNKIDLASHKKWIKSRMRELQSHGHFLDIFFVSAKYGTGLTPIINLLKKLSKPGPWSYPADMITTLSKVQLVEQLVRTYTFCWFNKDVPYRIEQKVIGWTYSENQVLNIEHELYVRTDKVAKMICGTRGRILKQMQKNISYKLSQLWNEAVFIFIHVKIR